MVLDDHLHLFRVEVVAVVLDQVLESAVEEQDPLFVEVAEVPSLAKAVFGPGQIKATLGQTRLVRPSASIKCPHK